ncbi:hypothetical protein DK37_11925 [Halomonas sp. SUBG004]|nr:hypothetical protein DK37_11925 [Halomonas sp. SUBG004]
MSPMLSFFVRLKAVAVLVENGGDAADADGVFFPVGFDFDSDDAALIASGENRAGGKEACGRGSFF